MRSLWIATAVLALLLATSTSSRAATATRALSCDRYMLCRDVLTFKAEPGEANVVTVALTQGGTVMISDAAGVQAGIGCVQVRERAISCASPRGESGPSARFDLRDRDDVLDARNLPGSTTIDGGRGADRLRGPREAAGLFAGGPGDDWMAGGTGPDVFSEGRRRNGSDTIFGGGGRGDQLFYGSRREGVHVDAEGDRDDGALGERDRIVGVPVVIGGLGDDVLIGGPGDDDLNGNHGRDLLRGGSGDDRLDGGDPKWRVPGSGPLPSMGDTILGGRGIDEIEGGLGRDTVNAGPGPDWVGTGGGADRIAVRDGAMDMVFCEGGRPDVAVNDRVDFVEGCERHRALRGFATPLSWADPPGSLSLLVGCPPRSTPCEGRIVVRRDGTVLGEAPFLLHADSHGYVYVETPGRSDQSSMADATVTVVSKTASGESSEDFPLSDVCYSDGPGCFVGAIVATATPSRRFR